MTKIQDKPAVPPPASSTVSKPASSTQPAVTQPTEARPPATGWGPKGATSPQARPEVAARAPKADGFEGTAAAGRLRAPAPVEASASGAAFERAVAGAQRGDLGAVQSYLAAGGSPNATGAGGRSLLGWAAVRQQPEIVQALLGAGASPTQADRRSGALPIHLAAQAGNVEVLNALLAAAPETREAVWPLNGHTPLVEAAFNQRPEVVEALLAAGADTGASSVRGRTPLNLVATEQSPAGTRIRDALTAVGAPATVDPARLSALLAREGIAPPPTRSAAEAALRQSATDVQQAMTSIANATTDGEREAGWNRLRALEPNAATLNALGGELSQPSLVFLGTTGGTEDVKVDVLNYLLERGADPFAAELHPMAVNAVFRPAVFGQAEVLRTLLAAVPPDRRAEYVNQQGVANGMTPLHDAVLRAGSGDAAVRLDVIQQLVAAGARTDIANDAGETVLDVARRLGNTQVLDAIGGNA
jgi:uncharacterized protein